MIKITRECYCDACGKNIIDADYIGTISVRLNEDETFITDDYDFCKDCMISFKKWREERKKKCIKY